MRRLPGSHTGFMIGVMLLFTACFGMVSGAETDPGTEAFEENKQSLSTMGEEAVEETENGIIRRFLATVFEAAQTVSVHAYTFGANHPLVGTILGNGLLFATMSGVGIHLKRRIGRLSKPPEAQNG